MGRFGKRAVVSAVAAAAGTAVIALPGAAPASASGGRAVAARVAGRVISYHGYRLRVPASWPVFRLADSPSRCILFNRHAVYLGRPGTDQSCPARAFGRTEAVLVQPMGSPGNLPSGTVLERGRRQGNWPAGTLAAQNATAHVMRIALPAAGVLVTATYGQGRPEDRRVERGPLLADRRVEERGDQVVVRAGDLRLDDPFGNLE